MASEDEMARWYHQCNGHELRQTPGDGEGQGGLICCSPWGHNKLDVTGPLNNNNKLVELLQKILARKQYTTTMDNNLSQLNVR